MRDGQTSLALYLNGKKVPLTVSNTVGTGAAAAFSLATTPNIGSNNITTDLLEAEVERFEIINRALTAAEVELVSRGQSLGFADEGASGSAAYTSDFSAGADGWADVQGVADGNIDSVGGENDTLRFTLDTAAGSHYAAKNSIMTVGKRYRVTGQFFIPSANGYVDGLKVAAGASQEISDHPSASLETWVSFSGEVTAESTNLLVIARDGASESVTDPTGTDRIYLKDIVVTQLGEVLKFLPESAASAKWYNEGGAGSSADGTVTGATLINERKRGVFDDLYLDNVPSSDAGLSTGEVYRDNNGHLKIVI